MALCEACNDKGEVECEGADFICAICGYTGAEGRALEDRLKRAIDLLRSWRDKYGGKEHHAFGTHFPGDRIASASPTDLIRDTQRFLEGK